MPVICLLLCLLICLLICLIICLVIRLLTTLAILPRSPPIPTSLLFYALHITKYPSPYRLDSHKLTHQPSIFTVYPYLSPAPSTADEALVSLLYAQRLQNTRNARGSRARFSSDARTRSSSDARASRTQRMSKGQGLGARQWLGQGLGQGLGHNLGVAPGQGLRQWLAQGLGLVSATEREQMTSSAEGQELLGVVGEEDEVMRGEGGRQGEVGVRSEKRGEEGRMERRMSERRISERRVSATGGSAKESNTGMVVNGQEEVIDAVVMTGEEEEGDDLSKSLMKIAFEMEGNIETTSSSQRKGSGLVQREGSGMLPRGTSATGMMERKASGNMQHEGSTSGGMQREISGIQSRKGSNMSQRKGSGSDGLDTIQREDSGNVHRSGSGLVQREGSGVLPRGTSGKMERKASGNMQREGSTSGGMLREGSGVMQRKASGTMQREDSRNMERRGSGIVQQKVSGTMQRDSSGKMATNDGDVVHDDRGGQNDGRNGTMGENQDQDRDQDGDQIPDMFEIDGRRVNSFGTTKPKPPKEASFSLTTMKGKGRTHDSTDMLCDMDKDEVEDAEGNNDDVKDVEEEEEEVDDNPLDNDEDILEKEQQAIARELALAFARSLERSEMIASVAWEVTEYVMVGYVENNRPLCEKNHSAMATLIISTYHNLPYSNHSLITPPLINPTP